MPGSELRWHSIARDFPPGLDTDTDPTRLQDGFTPDAYGLELNYPGKLMVGTVPTGTVATAKTYTIDSNTWKWFFKRAWRASGANLYYNAPEYTEVVLYQDLGVMSFDEDGNALATFFPVGPNMFVAKSTGGYFVDNAFSLDGKFTHGDILESMAVGTDGNAAAWNGIVYASNGYGLMASDGRSVAEITEKVRTIGSKFQSKTVTVDRQRGRLVIDAKMVYDPATKRLYDFSTSGFRWTSRVMIDPTGRPFLVDAVAFDCERTDETNIEMTLQVKRDSSDWEGEESVTVVYEEGSRNRFIYNLERATEARRFQIRVTAMTGNVKITGVDIRAALTTAEEGQSE